MADREDQLDPQLTEVDETPPWAARDTEQAAPPPEEPPVGVSETARQLESEGFFDRLAFKKSIDDAAARSEAVAKSAGSQGILGESFGLLTPGESRAWLREARTEFDAKEQRWAEFRAGPIERGRTNVEGMFGPGFAEATKPTLEGADADVAKQRAKRGRELSEMEAGTRAPAMKTPLRSAVENVPQGAIDLAGGIVKSIGIGAGIAGRDVFGADIAPDDNITYSLGKFIEAKGKELFPADPARQTEFTQKLAHGAGSMIGFYGPAIAGKLLGASDRALIGITMTTGGLAEGAETFEQGMASRKAGRDVSDADLRMAYGLGLLLGTSEALPVAAMFSRRGGLLRGVGIQMFEEGGQEGGQTFGENVIAKMLHDPERALSEGVVESATIGGILGAFMQGANYAVSKKARDQARPQPAPAATPAPAVEPPAEPEKPKQETPANAYDVKQFYDGTEEPAPALRDVPLEDKVEGVKADLEPTRIAAMAVRKTPEPPEDEQLSIADEIAAAQPQLEPWQKTLSETLVEIAKQTEANRPALEQDVEANLPTYTSAIKDVYAGHGLPYALADDAVRSVAINMAQGLTAEEALKRYAAEGYEQERAPRAQGTGTSPAAADARGARQGGPAAPGVGSLGDRLQSSAAAQQPGGSKRGVQQTDVSDYEQDYQRALRASFRAIVASRRPANEWGKALKLKPAELKALVDEAVRDGLLRIDRNGVIRRTKLAKVAPKETPIRPGEDIAHTPPDIRARDAIAKREAETGKQIAPDVRRWAQNIEEAIGRPAFAEQLSLVREAARTGDLSLTDMRDLVAMVGLRDIVVGGSTVPLSKMTKAGALLAIQRKHDIRVQERQAAIAAAKFEFDTGIKAMAVKRPGLPDERVRRGIERSRMADTLRQLATDAGTALGDEAAFPAVLRRLKAAAKKMSKADALELARLVGYQPKSRTTKAQALQSITLRHQDIVESRAQAQAIAEAQEAANAERQALLQSQGAVPEGELSQGVSETAGVGGTGGAPGTGGPGGGRDVARPGSPDVDGQGSAGELPGEGAGTRGDTREGARDGDAGTDLRSARPVVDTEAVRAQVEADAARNEQARADRVANNYTITEADEIGKGGPKAKVRANLAAIRTLRQIEEEKRPATAEEKKTLVKYVGWGAFAQDVFATHKPEWAKERAELQNLLSPEEYKSARASTLNAHFTSPEVITGMWSALEWLGFKGGRAIEPAAGIGHFIGLQPENMRADTNWTAVELDKISGGITKALYGASDVRVGGFEEQVWPDNYFDLAVSNVPFGDFKIEDTERKGFLIHDYFFVKALAKVRPGGIVAFITSAGTLDKQGGAARRAMDKQGTFLGAIRLPGGNKGAFKANAGTDVTTDIVFFRKRIPGEPVDVNSEWRELAEVNTPEGKTSINGYFAANPKMMLGKMRLIGSMYGKGEPVLIGPTDNLEAGIAEAAQRMPEDAMLPATTSAAAFEEKVDTEVDAIKEGAFYAKDGQIFRKITGVGHPQKLNKANAERVAGFIGMRDTVNRMLAIQSGAAQAADGEMDSLRAALNADYDAFVKKFGPINLTHITETKRKKDGKVITTRRMPNFSPIEDDNDAYKVKALEVYDEKTQKAKKAAIFTEDVVGSYTRPAVTGPSDALAVSLNETGRVDMALIADQLGVGEAEAAAVLGDRVYQNPSGGQWQTAAQYLSGDVVKKLADAKASAELDESYARNVSALEEVQPEPLSRAEITVPFGASWVPAEIYEAFLQDVVGSEFKVTLNEVTKQWRVTGSRRASEAAQAQWGTDRKSVGEIVEAALNSKPIIITDKQRDGSSVRDIEGETAARAKVELLREAFTGQTFPGAPAAVGGWVWNDDARAMRLEELYNLGFNRIVKEDHDGAHLTFPGLARVVTFPDGATGTINLTPARTSAIWRIIQNGNTLIDHVVGAGKTWTSIMAVMEMKRLGMVRRPMFVVPNHMLHQFSNEFLQAYPAAKLLVATKDNMSAAKRKEFAAKAAAEKWDGIIITHSAFGRLRMRDEAYVAYYEEAIERMIEAKDRAAQEEGKDSATVKDIEKARKRLKAKLEKFTAKEKKDLGITFEELGVDHLTVDEAHLFKNLWFPTRHTRVRGISNATESQRATDLYIKIRNLEKSKPGRSTLFLTGTPLSNTMAEVYTMMRYLQHDTLEEYGIGEFDSWAQTFGNIKTKTELAPNGRDFRDTTSFGEFVNIPELATLYGRIADTQTAESLKLPRPTLKGGKPIVVETELAPTEENFVQELIAKMEAMKGKRPEKGAPNFLSLFTQGLQVGTDFRLVDPNAPFNPNGKIAKAVDNIFSVWERGNKDEKAPNKAQLVFLDMGVPGSKVARKSKPGGTLINYEEPADITQKLDGEIERVRKGLADVEEDAGEQLQEEASEEDAEAEALLAGKFNLYQDIKDHLIERGVPADQIAFIHDAKNDEQKAKLFDAVREGKVRILLGSSAKMGVGTNVQKRLVAMHHIDAPWKPADVEQRDGRILRQGNKNPEIEIYRYVTKRSFDSYRWQILENKSHFIGQFRAGARGVRIATDIDAPLPEAAELKAAATGDPRIIEHADLSREVRVLDAQRAAHLGGAVRAKSALVQARARIESMRKHLEVYNQDAAKVQDLKGDNFSVALDLAKGTQTVTERKKAGEAVKAYLTSLAERSYYGAQDFDLGEISGFRMQGKVRRNTDAGGFVVQPEIAGAGTYPGQEFSLNADTNPITLIQRYERLAGTPLERRAAANATVANLEQEIPKLEAKTAATAFPKEADLADKRKRLNDLERALRPRDPAAQASEDAYVEQAMRNLKATSRTAAGVVDTSASAGKAGQMAEGLTGEGAAAAATRNFEEVIRSIYRNRDRIAGLSSRELAQEIDQIAIAINKGILKEGALYRADDSTKFPYTAVADLGAAHQQFAQELSQRLNDPNADPVETAAWIEWRANLTDHFWADGVGKTSKALAAIPLMRANQPLPLYRSNKEFFANASRQQYNPAEGGSAYRDAAWDKFLAYYRSLMPGADPTLEEMERIGQEAFASPEYQAALAAAMAQPDTLPKSLQGKGRDPDEYMAWASNRTYTIDGQEQTGIVAAIDATIAKARSYVTEGEVANESKAIVLLGLPGSGKSTISSGFANLTKSAVLNGDDTKEFIPEYANGLGSIAVHEEASEITKAALLRLLNDGANVLLEKTGSSPGSITGLINTLRAKGYSVQLVHVDVPMPLAMHQVVQRFKKNGRVVPPAYFSSLKTSDVFAILKQEGAADGYTVVERKTPQGEWRFTARDQAFAGIADSIERTSAGVARVVRGGGEASGRGGRDALRDGQGSAREAGQGQVEPDDTSLLALDGHLPDFTPQFQAAASEFAPALERELRAMLPGDIPVKMVDKLFRSGYAAYGGYDPLTRTIKVATSYGRGTAALKGFHEVGHALREYGRRFGEIARGLYTVDEWAILTERARKTGIKVSNEIAYRSMYSKDIARERFSRDAQQERMEELLDQERVFKLAEQWAAGTNFGAKVNTLLERIGLFFQAVRNALRGLGFQTADDVFRRMVSGEIAARAGQRQGAVSLPPVITPQDILLSSPEGQEALGSMGLMATNAKYRPTHVALAEEELYTSDGDIAKAIAKLDANAALMARPASSFPESAAKWRAAADYLRRRQAGGVKALDGVTYSEDSTKEEQLARAFVDEFGFKNPTIKPSEAEAAEETLKGLRLVAEITGLPKDLFGRLTGARLSFEAHRHYAGSYRRPLLYGLIPGTLHVASAQPETAVHEFGHLIDNAARGSGVRMASERPNYLKVLMGIPNFVPVLQWIAIPLNIGIRLADRYITGGATFQSPLPRTQFPWMTEAVRAGFEDVMAVLTGEGVQMRAVAQDRGRLGKYYSQPVELFARAFEYYIYTKARDAGYLSLAEYRSELPFDLGAASAPNPQRLIRGFDAIFAGVRENIEQGNPQLFALASSHTPPRPFTLSIDGRGEVSTREKEDGNRVRSYKVFGRETEASAAPIGRPSSPEAFVLSEQSDGSWELSFFNGGKDSAQIISDIESDLGNRIGPSGWLTPEAYEQWQATAPEKVADHQDAGPLFQGMYASPKAVQLAAAVMQEAQAQPPPIPRRSRYFSAGEYPGFYVAKIGPHEVALSFTHEEGETYDVEFTIDGDNDDAGVAPEYQRRILTGIRRGVDDFIVAVAPSALTFEAAGGDGSKRKAWRAWGEALARRFGGTFTPSDSLGSMRVDFPPMSPHEDADIGTQITQAKEAASASREEGRTPAATGDRSHAQKLSHLLSLSSNLPDGDKSLASLKSEGGRIEPQLPWPTEGVRAASMPHPVQMGSQATTSSLEAPELGLSDLVEELTDTLGLTVRQGRIDPGMKARAGRAGARMFGQFSAATGITRTAIPHDFPTLVHEGGHALEVRPSTRDPLAQLKATHAAELVPGNPAPSAVDLSEGFAEWFRFYLTDRTKAQAQAPGFLKDFEDMLDAEEPGMLEALEQIQDGFQALLKASPAGAVRSRIQSTERPGKLGEIKEELQEKGFRKTLSDKLYAFFLGYTDRWHGLKVAVDHMLEQGGRQAGINLAAGERLVLKAINDPYKRARLAAQAKAQATATLLNGVRLRGTADPSGPSYQDALDVAFGGNRRSQWNEEKAELFGSYLISRSMLAEFDRHDRGELENPPDQLIPRDVWAKAKDDIEKAHPEFARAAPILYQFQQNMLKLMYQEGFLDAEEYQTYANRVDYVPRNRVMPDQSPSSVGAARGTNKRKVFMRFKGSTLDFINPLESIAQNVYGEHARITVNGVNRALINLAQWAGPAGGAIAERLPAQEMTAVRFGVREALKAAAKQLDPDNAQNLRELADELFDENAAAMIFRATEINERGERIVYLYEDGKRVPIRMGDHDIGKDIFDAFTAVGTDNANMAFELATMGTQALRFGVTKAVSYVFNNFLRDQLQTWTLSENYTPFVTGTKGLKHVIANDEVSKRAAAFGVMMGGIDTNLQESAARDRDIKSLRRKGFWAVPLNWPRALHPVEWSWKAFMRTMEITEAGTRVGHMKAIQDRALADDMTPEEAAWEAAYGANDVMPFDRSGSKMMVIARLVAFLNAAVQGMSAAGRTISGERNTYTNYRDAVSPYLRAGMGQPVSVADRAAIPNAAKVWVKMLTMGIVGVSLAALYSGDDDESKEYQEFNDYMRATHWFFKINGTWWRFPKPFELAAISNAMEAGFAGYWKQDPRALKTFAQSLKHTMVPPHELQALKLYYEMMTGKDTFRDKDIVGGDLRALAPEYQFNAYTSELGRMVGKVMGWSPAQIDHFMAGALGTLGRDLLNASDYMLPRINKMTGGIIPGVSQTPRAEKSLEDMWFVSRFSRRAGRGALSVEEFWKQASRDGGKYTQAAETYKRLVAAGRADPRLNFEAKSFMERLTDDQKAYAYLEGGWFDEKDKDLHPVHRSRQVLQAIAGVRKDILMDNLVKRSTVPDRRHKFREPEKVTLSPSDQRVVNEILEDLSMREARNALIVTGHPGWAQKEILGTDGLVKELRSKAPAVAEELEARLTKGRTKVVPFEKVQEAWPEARARILKEGPEASLADLRGYVPPSGTLEILITKPKPKRGSLTIQ
jgi:N12 class adenine-specific DNA methylase